jgi:hypothetical protein
MTKNKCDKCECRVDGTDAKKYCYHAAFDEPSPHYSTSGRIIAIFPKTPKWCPRKDE